ncbi:MAG: hypothetical protein MRY77_05360 [Rhodobacteraceae bacterium]|nr:hypothetical protein [Paracoccaceae bacterium]
MKQWLNDNKIYFEIGSTLVFGIASVLVAVAANNVSQNQLEVAKIQLAPLIFVSEKYFRDEAGVATETYLEVKNAGAPIYGFSVATRTFYIVSTSSGEFWVPVNGYYSVIFELDAVEETLAEVRGTNNNFVFSETYLQQLKSDHDPILGYAEFERTTLTRVSYETREKEVAVEFFVGEQRSDDPWIEEAFGLHNDHVPLEVSKLDWPAVVEAALTLRTTSPKLIRYGGF